MSLVFDEDFACTMHQLPDARSLEDPGIIEDTQVLDLKQCFIQNNDILPVDDDYSELITKSGTYEIYVEIFNEKYSENISITETLRVN